MFNTKAGKNKYDKKYTFYYYGAASLEKFYRGT